MDYQKIYNQIIDRAKNRITSSYVEKHHVIPKCIGGTDCINNIVKLTAKEHFLCHKLLVRIHPTETKLWYALWLMAIGKNKHSDNHYNITSREYAKLREEYVFQIKGKNQTEEHIQKRADKNRGQKRTEEQKAKMGKKPEGFNQNNLNLKGRIINNKCVMQYDLEGNFIKEWVSCREAHRVLGIHYGSISLCCLGKGKTAGKFIWKYK
jgi:hypothetical protein